MYICVYFTRVYLRNHLRISCVKDSYLNNVFYEMQYYICAVYEKPEMKKCNKHTLLILNV